MESWIIWKIQVCYIWHKPNTDRFTVKPGGGSEQMWPGGVEHPAMSGSIGGFLMSCVKVSVGKILKHTLPRSVHQCEREYDR